jgi:outer membrane protein assembly factor BamE
LTTLAFSSVSRMTTFSSLRSVLLLVMTVLSAFAASGCVHRIPIQQGNFLDREDLDRVAVGMTRVQVRALLGTPMIADPFHQERWDYFYYLNMNRMDEPQKRQFTIYFDEQDKVARFEEPIRAPDTPAPASEELPDPPEQTAQDD